MVGVAAGNDSRSILIFGHGLTVDEDFELHPGIVVSPHVPTLDFKEVAAGSEHFADYAAVVHGREIATFSIRVSHDGGGKFLATKGWNSLWNFHLLSVACRTPCLSLFSVCDGSERLYSAATPSPFIRAFPDVVRAKKHQLEWARDFSGTFDELLKVSEFNAAVRCYVNAHILPEQDVRIMLLWAGIEGLLPANTELRRGLALYAALIVDGSADQKAAFFDKVKGAYDLRSKAVHGRGLANNKLREGYKTAGEILITLIARCVELGRVPSKSELDKLAVSSNLAP